MNNKYTITNTVLTFDNQKSIKFQFPIEKVLEYEGNYVILLNVYGSKVYNRNIFLIDSQARILWQVDPEIDIKLKVNCPFTSIEIENDELKTDNWCGYLITLSLFDGTILKCIFAK